MKRFERCILATCPVPWDENYNFAEDIFRDQLRHILKYGTKHIYIFGTAGEGYAVSDSQFARITEVFCDEMEADQAEPMVGIISLSLPTIIERIRLSYELGVRCFQISLPSWGRCNFDEIRRFFGETCGLFEDCSFLHYNLSRSKRLIVPDEYVLLADEFPNLVATKCGATSAVDIISLVRKVPQAQHFLTDFNFAIASLLGLDIGFLISTASGNWKTARQFYNACIEHKVQDINKYTIELSQIDNALLRIVGQQGHLDGVYDKMYSKIADNQFPLRLLPPYSYADDESFWEYVKYIKENHPHWISEE